MNDNVDEFIEASEKRSEERKKLLNDVKKEKESDGKREKEKRWM